MCRRMKPLKKCRATGSLAMMSNSDVGFRLFYLASHWPASGRNEREDFDMIDAHQAALALVVARERIAVAADKLILLPHVVQPALQGGFVDGKLRIPIEQAPQWPIGGDLLPIRRRAGLMARRINPLVAQVHRRPAQVLKSP